MPAIDPRAACQKVLLDEQVLIQNGDRPFAFLRHPGLRRPDAWTDDEREGGSDDGGSATGHSWRLRESAGIKSNYGLLAADMDLSLASIT